MTTSSSPKKLPVVVPVSVAVDAGAIELKRHRSIKHTLRAATAALFGATTVGAAGPNHTETSVLIYSEQDRVKTKEALFSLEKQLRNNYTFNLRLTFDGLTGASPTGGSPSKRAQTLTRPSGGSVVLVKAGEIPVNDSFRETRFAADAGLTRRLSGTTTGNAAVHLSSEKDYRSLGLSGGINKDFDNGKTNLGFSVAALSDLIAPVGGVPSSFRSITAPVETENGRRINNGNSHKRVYDIAFSFTRVLSPEMLARFTYSFEHSSGYLTDIYKVISLVQPPDSDDPGEPVDDIYERRPNRRAGHALSSDLRRHLIGMKVETGYRYYWDDWSIKSHTAYFSFTLDMKKRGALRPRVRWYHQGRASFSKPFLLQGSPLPDYASSDSRLAKFDAVTYGLTYSVSTSPTTRLTITTEWYKQRGDKSPPESFGPLKAFNLFPDLDALILRVGILHNF